MKDIYVKDGSLFLVPNSAQKAENIIEKIQNLVKKVKPEFITINLCGLNMFDALKIASLTGAYGLINNFHNKYKIIVDNEVTLSQINLLSLNNVTAQIEKEPTKQNFKNEKELVIIV